MNSYFPHDSNARNDAKILKVRMKYGAEGYGVYFMLLERLRDDSEYLSVKDYNMIAFDLRVDASLIKDIVENFGLFAFTDDGECFYSESFNRRMSIKDEVSNKRAAAGKKGAAKRWNGKAMAKPSSENSKAIAKPPEDDGNKSKVKESKQEKSIPPKSPTGDGSGLTVAEEFATEVWPAYPKKQGNYAKALETYVQAVESGETTKDQVLAKIAEYKAYIKLNNKQEGFVMAAGNWFMGHGWHNEYDTKNPEKTDNGKANYGKPTRTEKLPDWAQEGYKAPKHKVTAEQRKALAEQRKQLQALDKDNQKG